MTVQAGVAGHIDRRFVRNTAASADPADAVAQPRTLRAAAGFRNQVLAAAVLLGAWQAGATVLDSYRLPSPSSTVARFARDIASGVTVEHASLTLLEAGLGLVAGAVPAVGLALLLRRQMLATRVLEPFVMVAYGLPKVILTPLFIVWLGVGVAPKVAVVALSAFFVVYINALTGVRSSDDRLLKIARVLGATPRDVVLRFVLPAAMPVVMIGIRTAIPYSIGSAVFAEVLSGNRGLGYLLQFSAASFDTVGVFAALLTIGAVVFVLSALAHVIDETWVRPDARR